MTLVQVSDFGGDRPRRSDSRRRAVEMEGGGGCGEVASDPLCDRCANQERIYANLRLLDIPKPSSFALGVVLAHFTCHEIP
jgi:hypothetical protein